MVDGFMPLIGMTGATILADGIWLYLNHGYHAALFQDIQQSPLQVRWIPAILVYVIILAAVYFFAVVPSKSIAEALKKGALLGFAMYGLYDLTNYATLTNYSFTMTVTDMAWGTFLCALVAGTGYYLRK